MLFGWWKGREPKPNTWIGQARWLERCLIEAGIPPGDRFRLAQNRVQWRKRVQQAFPEKTLTLRYMETRTHTT